MLLYHYILKDISGYTHIIETDETNRDEELLPLLDFDLPDEDKLKIVDLIEQDISIVGMNCSDTVKAYILEGKPSLNNFDKILTNYAKEGEKTKEEIKKLAVERYEDIFNGNLPVPNVLLQSIIDSPDVTKEIKSMLLAAALPSLTKEQCIKYISQLKLEKDFSRLIDDDVVIKRSKKFRVKNTQTNKYLLRAYAEKGWIPGFEEDKNDPLKLEIIKKRGTPPSKTNSPAFLG